MSLLVTHRESSLRVDTSRRQRGRGSAGRVGVIAIVLHREWNAIGAARGAEEPLMRRTGLGRVGSEIDRSNTVQDSQFDALSG